MVINMIDSINDNKNLLAGLALEADDDHLLLIVFPVLHLFAVLLGEGSGGIHSRRGCLFTFNFLLNK